MPKSFSICCKSGGTVGFRSETILILTDTCARNSRMTLMHYLCKVLADKLPEVVDYKTQTISGCTKMQLKLLAEKMQVITKGLSTVIWEKLVAKKDGCVSKKFQK
ncbi:hypothetical protein CTI12_AA317350 [Artemisia annua]|uniref:FH2 domain-containing protein n=1 Tax=Artemisia annua TaxID=35608 RepID=A0A2U1MZT8_ARTAN|nr:hypothetical protein CTI12_AA317350 [Artemisia annua]